MIRACITPQLRWRPCPVAVRALEWIRTSAQCGTAAIEKYKCYLRPLRFNVNPYPR